MALSNQRDLQAFFSARKVNLKIPINSGLGQAGIACPQKMTLGSWLHQTSFQIWQDDFRQHVITEDVLLGPGQFRLMTSRNQPGPGKSFSAI